MASRWPMSGTWFAIIKANCFQRSFQTVRIWHRWNKISIFLPEIQHGSGCYYCCDEIINSYNKCTGSTWSLEVINFTLESGTVSSVIYIYMLFHTLDAGINVHVVDLIWLLPMVIIRCHVVICYGRILYYTVVSILVQGWHHTFLRICYPKRPVSWSCSILQVKHRQRNRCQRIHL